METKTDKRLKSQKGTILVREFKLEDKPEVQRLFQEGLMEMVLDTAFRGLWHHPESLLLYTAITVVCVAITMCWWLIGLLPATLVCLRYFYSRRVIHAYLRQAMSTDMENIEAHYMKISGFCFWVAELEGKVVGAVAAARRSDDVVELLRMCVDQSYRRRGVGVVMGQEVLQFAAAHKYSSVVLGTTAYTAAAHQLYKRLGFHCVGVTNGYMTPGSTQSFLEMIFYRVKHYHYSCNVKHTKITSSGQH